MIAVDNWFFTWFGGLNAIAQLTVLLAMCFAVCVLLLCISIALSEVVK